MLEVLEAILSLLLDPAALFWKFFIVGMFGILIGATAVGGWKQWIE